MRWVVAAGLFGLWLLGIAVVDVGAPAHVLLVLALAVLIAAICARLAGRPAA
jgi:hypothetical protein